MKNIILGFGVASGGIGICMFVYLQMNDSLNNELVFGSQFISMIIFFLLNGIGERLKGEEIKWIFYSRLCILLCTVIYFIGYGIKFIIVGSGLALIPALLFFCIGFLLWKDFSSTLRLK